MTKKTRTPSTRRTVRLDELKSDPNKVAKAARCPAGVDVVDATGEVRFRLWIPSTALSGC